MSECPKELLNIVRVPCMVRLTTVKYGCHFFPEFTLTSALAPQMLPQL